MKRVRPSRPALARSFSARLNLVLTRGIPPDLRDGIHIHRQPPSGQSRIYRVTQLRTDGVHCRESVDTGPVVLKVVRVTGGAFSGMTMDHFLCASLFPRSQYSTLSNVDNSVKPVPKVWNFGRENVSCIRRKCFRAIKNATRVGFLTALSSSCFLVLILVIILYVMRFRLTSDV